MNKKLVLSILLTSLSLGAETSVSPTYIPRSQSSDNARKLAGLSHQTHLYEEDNYYNFAVNVEYTRSFNQNKIAQCLFGDDLVDCNKILVQGSAITGDDRNAKAWLADYFYLAPDYNSYFCIEPSIQNIMLNLDLFVGLDNIKQGLYFRAYGPVTYTRWNLNFSEPCDIVTTGSYNYGYFDKDLMLNNQLLGTFGDYAQGQTPLNTSGYVVSGGPSPAILPTTGVEFLPLQYAQIDTCAHSRTGFADLRLELGYDFCQDDDYHLGLSAQVAAPTGNRTEARWAFDPVIGNRKHWEAGAGLSGHYTFWHAQGEDKSAGFYLDFNVTHLNNAKEQRTFDLCGRPNSRYMLAMKMDRPAQYLSSGQETTSVNFTTPNSQFQGVFTPVANLTTLNLEVRNAVQADLAVMFNYSGENFALDLGYNFWVRSCDKFSKSNSIEQCCPSLCDGNRNMWALKGDAHVFGFMSANSFIGEGSIQQGNAIALSASQCGATIHNGTNATASGDDCTGVNTLQNCGIDNPAVGFGGNNSSSLKFLVHTPGLTTASDHIKTSLEPKFINCCDINLQCTRSLSNKFFANLNYTWDKDCYTPYFGVGGFAEFGKTSSDCNDCDDTPATTFDCTTACDDTCCDTQCCSPCEYCSLSQWGVWLQGGVNFQ